MGAASGLLAAGVQSAWETGLRMTANAALFALLAAIAMHEAGERRKTPKAQRLNLDAGPFTPGPHTNLRPSTSTSEVGEASP